MGQATSTLTPEDIEELRDPLISGFSPFEIKKLYKRFEHLDRSKTGYLTQDDLELIPELSLNPLCERVIEIFDPLDMNQINFKEFVSILWTFSSQCSKQKKLTMAFKIYDIDNDNKISINDLYRILKIMVGKHFDNDKLLKLCKKIISDGENKKEKQGYLTFDEFVDAIGEQQLINKMTIPFTFNNDIL